MAQREAGQRQEGPLDRPRHARGTMERRADHFYGFEDQAALTFVGLWLRDELQVMLEVFQGMSLHFFFNFIDV